MARLSGAAYNNTLFHITATFVVCFITIKCSIMENSAIKRRSISGDSITTTTTTMIPSLMVLCRTVVTNHLERYTPESFRICDIYEWDEIIQLRHSMTQPNKKLTLLSSGNHHSASNDIDGNGRLLPALSEKVLQQIEECNEHLADSTVADTLVWKDCVEFRFKRNVGLLRPPILFEPWPLLVHHIQQQCQILSATTMMEHGNMEDHIAHPTTDEINKAIHVLQSTTWNVALLRDTGIGKIVKRLLKKISNNNTGINTLTEKHTIILQQLLSGWMHLASTNNTTGIFQWKETTASTSSSASSSTSGKKLSLTPTTATAAHDHSNDDDAIQSSDLQLLEKCLSWRQLYQVLEHRKGIIQATQGKRMREIRNNVEMNRPKLVKVRPTAKAKQLQSIADPFDATDVTSSSNSKIAMLRNEASIQTGRLQVAGRAKKPSFGDAVAFAAVTKKGMAHKRKVIGGTIHHSNNGTKRMKIPSSVSSTTGTTKACPSRQFASKYKSSPVIKSTKKKT